MTEASPCPDARSWQSLLAAAPDAAPDEALLQHLEVCPACQARLQQLAGAAEFQGQVAAHLRETRNIPPAQTTLARRVASAAPAAPAPCGGKPEPDPAASADLDQSATSVGGRSARPVPPRERIGRYELLEELGRGGMGVVYRARDSMLGREVAIKMLAGHWADDPVALARFVREARAAAAVNNRFVVAIHAVESDGGAPYLVLEYVRGISLQQRLNAGGPLPLADIVRVGTGLALGLAAAHERGVLHRDIKPGNVLLAEDGEVKIGDFGLARAGEDDALTSLEVLAGTPAYLAPEQTAAKPVDSRADLFSLGSVLYAMCTGEAPFAGPTVLATVRQVADGAPRPIRQRNPAIPDWLVQLIERLHAKDPAQRIQTAAEVAQWLQRGLAAGKGLGPGNLPSPAVPAATGGRGARRKRLLQAAGVLAGVLVLTLAAFLVYAGRRPSGNTPATVSAEAPRQVSRPAAPAMVSHESYVVVRDGQARERRFSQLTDALRAAATGSTVTLHGAGPFAAGPLPLGARALAIRAAPGCVPVVSLSAADPPTAGDSAPAGVAPAGLWEAEGPLTIEGIELRGETPGVRTKDGEPTLVRYAGPSLRLDRCRLSLPSGGCCVRLEGGASCELRDCELHSGLGCGVTWRGRVGGSAAESRSSLELHNCLCSGRVALCLNLPANEPLSVTLADNTLATLDGCEVVDARPFPAAPPAIGIRTTMQADRNVFDHDFLIAYCPLYVRRAEGGEKPGRSDARRLVQLMAWAGADNVYSPRQRSFLAVRPPRLERPILPPGVPQELPDWVELWNGHERRPCVAEPQYTGGPQVRERAILRPGGVPASALDVSFADLPGSPHLRRGARTEQVGPEGTQAQPRLPPAAPQAPGLALPWTGMTRRGPETARFVSDWRLATFTK